MLSDPSMSNDLRRGRGRPTARALVAFAFLLLAPTASAQSAAEIILPEVPPTPGEVFSVTFRVPGGILDLGVQDHVTCEMGGVDGTTTACDWRGDVVTVRVLPTSVDYVLELVAPNEAGDFTLRISRAPLADSALLGVSAETTLSVRPPVADEPLQAGEEDEPARGPTNIWNIFVGRDPPADPAGSTDPAGDEHRERWMVSSTAGSAALLALVVAGRKGGSR